MTDAQRHPVHICDSLLEIEEALTDKARVWAEVQRGDGDKAFFVTCGDDPGMEPDGPCVIIGVTRVYCADDVAAQVLGALVGESIDENAA